MEQTALLQAPQANAPATLLCEGRIRIGWVDAHSLRPQRIPAHVLAALDAPVR
jgi:acyl-CoA thioester hydrolase